MTRDRVEHLTPQQRAAVASNTSMFESLLTGSVVSNTSNEEIEAMPYVLDEVKSKYMP